MSKINAVLLASGGMDSTVLAYWLEEKGEEYIPLFLDYGQHCKDTEIETLKRVLPQKRVVYLQIIDISEIYKGHTSPLIRKVDLWTERIKAEDLYLPYRNLLFLSVAAAFAEARNIRKVYAAFINSNHAQEIDCSYQFFERLSTILSDYGGVEIKIPFRFMTKTEVAKLGLKLGAPIAETFSCQVNSKVHCGACPNCVERLNAFNSLLKDEKNEL